MPTTTTTTGSGHGYRKVGAVLFLSMFAAQAGAIALSPVLAEVAADFHVSTAEAGQVRTVSGLVAGVTALLLAAFGGRVGLGRQLLGGATLVSLGSILSASAPGLWALFAAQVPVGAGIAVLTTAGTLAVAEWVVPERRPAVLSWTLIGQPSAWIVGMPLIGVVGGWSWRFAWLALPLTGSVVAAAAVAGRASDPPPSTPPARLRSAITAPGIGRWLSGELLSNTAWAGTLVYSGALFVESYGSSTGKTGIVLAIGAGAYVAGNMALRRWAGKDRDPRRLLVMLTFALALGTALFGALRPSVAASTALFSAAAAAAGGRTFVSSSFGLTVPDEVRPGVMAMRAATMQFGYFTGSFAAGTALALGGYTAFGIVMGLFFVGAGLALAVPGRRGRDATCPPWPFPCHPSVVASAGAGME